MIDVIRKGIEKEIKELESALSNINIKKVEQLEVNISEKTKLNINLPAKKPFIYVIKSINPVSQEKIKTDIENVKQKYAMCRINDNFQINNENCLYVGSSHNIIKRLQEHLGIGGSPKTYAMHLAKWWEYGSVSIEIYSIDGSDKCLQLYEDILWDNYKPILGRQGKK